tara:strand:- start:6034 stop:7911 length:1878 start_codon:yes stop_codon:yes gene_type:complete
MDLIQIGQKIIKLSPKNRRLILINIDIFIIIFSLFLSNLLIYSDFNNQITFLNYFIFVITGISIFYKTGNYKILTRFFSVPSVYECLKRNIYLVFVLNIFDFITNIFNYGLNFWIVFYLSVSLFLILSRVVSKDLINRVEIYSNNKDFRKKEKVIIYGAGREGAQLARSLYLNKNYEILAFVDENKMKWGRQLFGISIISLSGINDFQDKLDKIFIAIPSISKDKINQFINKYSLLKIPILIIPPLEDITKIKTKKTEFRPVNIDDLIKKEVTIQDFSNLRSFFEKKIILVTGAGGSIGKNLCKQICSFSPSKLIMIDHSEINLYNITNEISKYSKNDTEIVSLLGSLCDRNFCFSKISKYKPDTILHAAAYKHVNLVELNPIEGIYNNIFSTKYLCEAAFKYNVPLTFLISSDKAVRPSNVMGATKRFCELLIQGYNHESNRLNKNIRFSAVRFGNVIGSSGSVVPLFQKQIANGGPVTVTHSEVTRFFMTIGEAAQLVVNSCVIAKGGEIFLLDMGSPLKIVDLAKKLIKLNALSLKSEDTPKGDIEIKFSGLRPGEKLYEELLIDGDSERTQHPLIYKAIESFIEIEEINNILIEMEAAIYNNDVDLTKSLLKQHTQWKITN